jgi:hypothetical protein
MGSVGESTASGVGAAAGTAGAQMANAGASGADQVLGAAAPLSGAASDTLPAVDNTVGTVGQTAQDLLGALDGTSLLNLDANLNLNLDLAAPISLAVAANANAALPIDAGVGANILSPNALSLASAPQHATLEQQLAGDALATSGQDSSIAQGPAPAADTSGADAGVTAPTVPTANDLTGGLSSLLDLNVNLDLGLDLAAPIDGAIAANANVAAPIDAAVSANVLSPDATSVATADQNAVIIQTLQGVANATTNQTSTIDQGAVPAGA